MAKGSLGGDAGFKKKKSSKDEAELDITPMIDVTFLLLIFFMVTSTMDDQKPVNVPPAVHGVGAETNSATIVSILADPGGGPARVIMGDGSAGEEAPNLELVRRYVQAGFNDGKELCIVKAERDVKEGKVQEVLKILAEIDGLRFAVGVQDQ
jgi:biopolymer transport protein TolR